MPKTYRVVMAVYDGKDHEALAYTEDPRSALKYVRSHVAIKENWQGKPLWWVVFDDALPAEKNPVLIE